MRNTLNKLANNAACKWSIQLHSKAGKKYEDEDNIHLFKPFSLALAVDGLHSCVLGLDLVTAYLLSL